jgi:hypothetical protein
MEPLWYCLLPTTWLRAIVNAFFIVFASPLRWFHTKYWRVPGSGTYRRDARAWIGSGRVDQWLPRGVFRVEILAWYQSATRAELPVAPEIAEYLAAMHAHPANVAESLLDALCELRRCYCGDLKRVGRLLACTNCEWLRCWECLQPTLQGLHKTGNMVCACGGEILDLDELVSDERREQFITSAILPYVPV